MRYKYKVVIKQKEIDYEQNFTRFSDGSIHAYQ